MDAWSRHPDIKEWLKLGHIVQQTSRGRHYTVKALSKAGKLSDIACSIICIISCIVMVNFMPKNSVVTKFCQFLLGGLVIMSQHVDEIY